MRPAAYFFLCTSIFDIEYLAAIYHVRWAVPPVHVFIFNRGTPKTVYTTLGEQTDL